MKKHLLLITAILWALFLTAQEPAGYYNAADGKKGKHYGLRCPKSSTTMLLLCLTTVYGVPSHKQMSKATAKSGTYTPTFLAAHRPTNTPLAPTNVAIIPTKETVITVNTACLKVGSTAKPPCTPTCFTCILQMDK